MDILRTAVFYHNANSVDQSFRGTIAPGKGDKKMMRQFSIRSVMQNVAYVLAGMLLAALILANGQQNTPLLAQETQEFTLVNAAAEPEAPTAEVWVTCTPVSVATLSNRVHVLCAESYSGVFYFAAPTSNPAHAARILSTLSTAQVAGRTLEILYDPADTSGSEFGCGESNCRVLLATGFGQ
jgi:hypothetical protein